VIPSATLGLGSPVAVDRGLGLGSPVAVDRGLGLGSPVAAVYGRAWTAAASTSVLWPVAGGPYSGGSVHQLGGPDVASAVAAVGLSGSDGSRTAW